MTDTLELDGTDAFTAVPDWLLERTDLSSTAFRLWVVLKSYLHRGSSIAWPRRSVLATRLGMTKAASVDRYIDELRTAGLLVVESHFEDNEGGGRRQGSNRYRLVNRPPQSPIGDPGHHSPQLGTPPVPKRGHQEADPVEADQSVRTVLESEPVLVDVPTPVQEVVSALREERSRALQRKLPVRRISTRDAAAVRALVEGVDGDAAEVRLVLRWAFTEAQHTGDRAGVFDDWWLRRIDGPAALVKEWPRLYDRYVLAQRARQNAAASQPPVTAPLTPDEEMRQDRGISSAEWASMDARERQAERDRWQEQLRLIRLQAEG